MDAEPDSCESSEGGRADMNRANAPAIRRETNEESFLSLCETKINILTGNILIDIIIDIVIIKIQICNNSMTGNNRITVRTSDILRGDFRADHEQQ